MSDDLFGDLACVPACSLRIECHSPMKSPGVRVMLRRDRIHIGVHRNWSPRRDRRRWRFGFGIELAPGYIWPDKQAGVAVINGDVLASPQSSVPMCRLIVAFCIRERVLLPSQQCKA